MKKLIVGLLMAFLMATGLVAATNSTATAACPYQGCFNTKTSVSDKVSGSKATITVKVRTVGSTKNPQGTVTLIVKKGGKSVYKKTKTITGGKVVFTTPKLKKGKYSYSAAFKKKPNSAFNNSSAKGSFTIKK